MAKVLKKKVVKSVAKKAIAKKVVSYYFRPKFIFISLGTPH